MGTALPEIGFKSSGKAATIRAPKKQAETVQVPISTGIQLSRSLPSGWRTPRASRMHTQKSPKSRTKQPRNPFYKDQADFPQESSIRSQIPLDNASYK